MGGRGKEENKRSMNAFKVSFSPWILYKKFTIIIIYYHSLKFIYKSDRYNDNTLWDNLLETESQS
jgi:hypothetical protein